MILNKMLNIKKGIPHKVINMVISNKKEQQ